MESTTTAVTGNGIQKLEPDATSRAPPAMMSKNQMQKQPKEIHYVNPFVHKLIWDDPIDKVKVSKSTVVHIVLYVRLFRDNAIKSKDEEYFEAREISIWL